MTTQVNSTVLGTLGNVNVTGNVLASTVLADLLTANALTVGNVAAGFVGNTGTAFTGASINVTGNVSASSYVGGSVNVTGNISANRYVGGNINITGNLSASNLISSTSQIGTLRVTGSLQTSSFGVGTAASGTSGEIRATNNITAYYSDERLKTRLGNIENALDKVDQLHGFYHEANDLAQSLGYAKIREVGVSAQEVQQVLPEIVAPAPIDEQYLTVRYERLTPLLIEAIKELRQEINEIKRLLGK